MNKRKDQSGNENQQQKQNRQKKGKNIKENPIQEPSCQVESAIRLFLKDSGSNEFDIETIKKEEVTEKDLKAIVEEWKNEMELKNYFPDGKGKLEVRACGCCGIKQLVAPSVNGQKFKAKEYNWEEIEITKSKELFQPLIVTGGTNSYATLFKHDGNYIDNKGMIYHLIPNLIVNDKVSICGTCYQTLKKGKIPSYSLAKIGDFGVYKPNVQFCNSSEIYEPTELPKLSFLETLLITKSVVHVHMVKLQANATGMHQQGLKGNCIVFNTNGVAKTVGMLPRLGLEDILVVKFYGKTESHGSVQQNFKNLTQFRVDPQKIAIWLRFLKMHNPHYRDVDIHPNVFENNGVSYSNLINEQLDSVFEITENEEGLLKEQIATDNIAVTEDNDGNSFQFVFVDQAQENQTLNTAATNLFDSVETQLQMSKNEMELEIREDDPIPLNEFENLDMILYGSFPTLFMFGVGLNSCKTISDTMARHLLLYHDNRFAENIQFIFYLFNVKMRHCAISNTSLYVKNNPSAVRDISQLIMSDNFMSRLADAKKNPDGKDAKELLGLLTKHIQPASSKLPFSIGERKLQLSQLLAYCKHFGTPSFFVTISPNDADNPLVINLADESVVSDCVFPPEYTQRLKIANENPVACAEVFYRSMEKVMATLIGYTPSYRRRANTSTTKGILGTPIAYFGVIETQGRGTLHLHFLVWTAICPKTLQMVAHDDIMTKTAAKVLDSLCMASIPFEYHKSNKDRLLSKSPPLRHGFETPTPDPADVEFFVRAYRLAAMFQTHNHSFTCHKGKVGKHRCRLCRPQRVIDETRPVLLTSGKHYFDY
jgi:hypothetical protein